jgi:hypothetical protein
VAEQGLPLLRNRHPGRRPAGLLSSALLPKSVYDWANPLLWCEAAAVWAFAAAWFVKGETVLTDAQVSSLRSGRARPWSQAPAGG